MDKGSEEIGPERELKRHRVRVRYRERTKLKRRPRGYYFFKRIKKHKGIAVLTVILIGVLIALTLFVLDYVNRGHEKHNRFLDEVKKGWHG
jgi:hypothetical protein